MKKTIAISSVLFALFSSTSLAQENSETKFSASYSYALSHHTLDGDGYEDESDNGGSHGLELSYHFTPEWSIQLGYTDFGEASPYSFQAEYEGVQLNTDLITSGKGKSLTFTWSSPREVEAWAMYAKLGLMNWETELSFDISTSLPIGAISSTVGTDSGTDIYGGLGATYRFSDSWDLILSADWLAVSSNIPLENNTNFDFQFSRYGIGIAYNF